MQWSMIIDKDKSVQVQRVVSKTYKRRQNRTEQKQKQKQNHKNQTTRLINLKRELNEHRSENLRPFDR